MSNITFKCLNLNSKHSFIKDFLVGLAFPMQAGIKSDKFDLEFTNDKLEIYYFYKPNLSTEYERTILNRFKYEKIKEVSFYKTNEKYFLDVITINDKTNNFEILNTTNLPSSINTINNLNKLKINNKII